MTLELPDEVFANSHWTEKELLLELAVGLYAAKRMSLAKAAEVAGLDRIAFSRVLAAREIPTMYGGVADLHRELERLRALGLM